MNKTTNEFLVVTKENVVKRIDRSYILSPRPKSIPKGGIKWFDDSQLIRKAAQ